MYGINGCSSACLKEDGQSCADDAECVNTCLSDAYGPSGGVGQQPCKALSGTGGDCDDVSDEKNCRTIYIDPAKYLKSKPPPSVGDAKLPVTLR